MAQRNEHADHRQIPTMRTQDFFTRNREPTRREMLDDPVVRLVMARDDVCVTDLEDLMNRVRVRLLRARWRGRSAA